MLFSAAGVAFTPTLRPHVTQPTARAAVACALDAPVPPVATVVLDAAARQATALQPASVSEAAASEAFSSAQQSIFPTNLLAAELFGQGKKFTGYKQRNTGAPADLAPAAEPDYSDTAKYEPTKVCVRSAYYGCNIRGYAVIPGVGISAMPVASVPSTKSYIHQKVENDWRSGRGGKSWEHFAQTVP